MNKKNQGLKREEKCAAYSAEFKEHIWNIVPNYKHLLVKYVLKQKTLNQCASICFMYNKKNLRIVTYQ